MRFSTKLKNKLGLCICEGCHKRAKYELKIRSTSKEIAIGMCEEHITTCTEELAKNADYIKVKESEE